MKTTNKHASRMRAWILAGAIGLLHLGYTTNAAQACDCPCRVTYIECSCVCDDYDGQGGGSGRRGRGGSDFQALADQAANLLNDANQRASDADAEFQDRKAFKKIAAQNKRMARRERRLANKDAKNAGIAYAETMTALAKLGAANSRARPSYLEYPEGSSGSDGYGYPGSRRSDCFGSPCADDYYSSGRSPRSGRYPSRSDSWSSNSWNTRAPSGSGIYSDDYSDRVGTRSMCYFVRGCNDHGHSHGESGWTTVSDASSMNLNLKDKTGAEQKFEDIQSFDAIQFRTIKQQRRYSSWDVSTVKTVK